MRLHQLSPSSGSNKKKKRLGRGNASGHGGTSTRGHKGAHSRSGFSSSGDREGGQMPLIRRIPKRGFTSPNKIRYQIVSIASLERLFTPDQPVTLAAIKEKGLVKKSSLPVKILGDGTIEKALEIHAHAFSASAKKKIEKAGGKVICETIL